VIDTNPPLIVFLTAIPVAVARLVPVGDPALFKAFVFALALLSIGLASLAIARVWTAPFARLLVTAVFAYAVVVEIGPDFGQREHLLVILAGPYVFGA